MKHQQIFTCQKVDAWVEKQLEVFTSGNYGTTYDLTKIIMDNFEEYKVQLAANQQVCVGTFWYDVVVTAFPS